MKTFLALQKCRCFRGGVEASSINEEELKRLRMVSSEPFEFVVDKEFFRIHQVGHNVKRCKNCGNWFKKVEVEFLI